MSWKGFAVLAAFVAVVGIAACPDHSCAAKQIRLGYLQSDLHHLAAFVALEKGFYKKEGLDVVVGGIFKAGPEEMSAFASRDVDFGYVGEAPATVAVLNKAADVKIIAQANLEGSAIVVRKSSGIKGLQDLTGKAVAVPGYATVQDFLLKKALNDAHIPVKNVNVIIIKPPEMIPALRTKQIDAFVAWEPYPSKAVTSDVGAVLVQSGKIWPKHPCCVVVADTRFIKTNPDAIMGILRAHIKATRFIHENPKEALEIAVKYTGMDADTVKLAIGNIWYEYVPDVQGLLEYVAFLKGLSQTGETDPKEFVRAIIDKSFLEKLSPRK